MGGVGRFVGTSEVLIPLNFSVKSGAKSLTVSVGEDSWRFQERGMCASHIGEWETSGQENVVGLPGSGKEDQLRLVAMKSK